MDQLAYILKTMPSNPNAHVLKYLDQYLTRDPQFALLLSGAWGSGKTHLLRRYFSNNTSSLYVSLNGAKSTDELTTRLYLAAYPLLNDKSAKALGGIARSVAGMFRLNIDVSPQDILDLDKKNIIIFDDLERCILDPTELFGFINNFVEHDFKHVILAANEDAFLSQRDYVAAKEKVIGFTLRLRADLPSALVTLAENLSSDYKEFLESHRDPLISLFRQGNIENLRAIRAALIDFEHPYSKAKSLGISDLDILSLLLVFAILHISFRVGDLTRDDIRSRGIDPFTRAMRQASNDYVPSALDILDKKFNNIDLFLEDLDNEFLEQLICDGFTDDSTLNRKLGDIVGRNDPQKNPEWRNLWYLLKQSDDVANSSMEIMLQKFVRRSYDDHGIILHVFGLMYKLGEVGLLKWSRTKILKEQLTYLQDKYNDGTLPIVKSDFIGGFSHGSAYGLGFTSLQEANFRKAFDRLEQLSSKLRDERLLAELKLATEGDQFDIVIFREILLQGRRDDNVFSRPFLNLLDANKLATVICNQTPALQFDIISSLGSRYHDSPYRSVEVGEAQWLRKLISRMRKITRNSSLLARYRLEELLKWNLISPSNSDKETNEASD